MPNVQITIKNLPQIKRAFGLAPSAMVKELNNAIRKSVIAVERESKILSPVLTGRLRGSHVSSFYNLRGEVGPTVDYAIYVHEGTRYMRARPFLYDAVVRETTSIENNFKYAVQNVLNQIGRASG